MTMLKDPAANKIKTTPHWENSGTATVFKGVGFAFALFSVSSGFAVGFEFVFVGLDV